MITNQLTSAAISEAIEAVGSGQVFMTNLLWFHDDARYPPGFDDTKSSGRLAYFEGYAGAFREIAQRLGVHTELIYAGERLHGLLAGPDDDWDAIVIVRYDQLSDLRKILEDEAYDRLAAPHRLAGVANWRFFATQAMAGR